MLLGRESYLAVDMGSHSIKAAGVNRGKEGLVLTAACIKKLPPGTVQNGLVREPSSAASLLEEIRRELGIKTRKVVLTVPGNTLVIRQIELPVMSDAEIKEAIKWEAEDYLPFPVEEASLDFLVLERAGEKMRVLLTAVKKEVINSFLEPLKRAGLKPVEITVQPLALTSLLAFQDRAGEPAAVIDIGDSGTRVIIGDEKTIYLARNINIGGREFTRLLMERKRLNYQEAEEYKKEWGLLEESEREDRDNTPEISRYITEGPDREYPLTGLAYQLSDEISRSLTYNPIEYKEETIQHVYLTGGGSRLKGLVEIINREVKQEVALLDPLKGLKCEGLQGMTAAEAGGNIDSGNFEKPGYKAGLDYEGYGEKVGWAPETAGDNKVDRRVDKTGNKSWEQIGSRADRDLEIAVAVGAAVNRIAQEFPINLLGREQKAPPVVWLRVLLTVALIIMLVVPGLIQFFASSRLNLLKTEVGSLKENIQLIKPRRDEYFSLQEKIEVLEAMSRQIEAARYYWDKVLLDYGYVVPEKARLNFVQIVEGSISLGGYAASNEKIIEVIRRMQQSPFFNVVQIKKLLKEGEVNFRIDAEVIRGSESNGLQNE